MRYVCRYENLSEKLYKQNIWATVYSVNVINTLLSMNLKPDLIVALLSYSDFQTLVKTHSESCCYTNSHVPSMHTL